MIFIDNKYTRWYYAIVNRSKTRELDPAVYTETHHIIPRCLGGNDSKDNLATLTGHEHLVCHLLLRKMTTGVAKRKMSFAAYCMVTLVNPYQKRVRITGRLFETLRKERRESAIAAQTGKKYSPEHCKNISKNKIGKKYGPQSEEHKKKKADANRGKKKPQTFEHKLKTLAGIEKSKRVCEYCNIMCSQGNYTKWHGPNCKHTLN